MKKNSKYLSACLLLLMLLLAALSTWTSSAQRIATSPQGAEVTELYTLVGAQKSRSAVSSAAVAEQEIQVAFDKIDFENAANLRLPLLNSKAYNAARRDREGFVRFSPDEFTWRGTITGIDGSSGDVVLSVKGRALSGLIYSPEGVYEIVPQKDFKHLLVLLDHDLFAPCGGAIPPNAATRDRSEKPMQPAPAADDGTQIDVMVVYTTPVLNFLGGTSQTQAFIQQAVAAANTAYQNSNISPRLRLVETLHVDFSEGGTTSEALNWVTTNAAVAAARNSSKADLVALLIEDSSNSDCGVAWVMRNVGPGFSENGFSVTKRSCAVGNLTFAHELGHNEGCEHNPENGALPSEASFPYAFGHYVDGVFRTVMSTSPPCPSGCPRRPHFSNPAVNFSGFPTGIADQRDNHRVINNTALIISQFRDSGGVSCSYSLDPTSRNFSATGASGSFNVSTGSACSWTAVVNAPSGDESLSFTNAMSSRQQDKVDVRPVMAGEPANDVFLNSTPVTINDRSTDAGPPGLGSLYPSTINVSGMTGTITVVQAALNGLSHTFPDDVDVLLVGPGGQSVMLMSDVGGGDDISAVNLIFEQTASSQLPDSTLVTSGTFRPTNNTGNTTQEPGGVDNFPSPGPGQGAYSSSLSVFNGTSPNGTWRLYVVDDERVDSGNIATGWALGILTSGGQTAWITVTSGSSGTGNGTVNYSVASNTGASQRTGTITVNGQVHTVTQAGTGGGGCPVTSIGMGQTLNGSLASSDCVLSGTTRYVDVYSFSGVQGQQISASMNSSAFDTYLFLANSANQVLTEDNNSGPGSNSRVPGSGFFTLPANGTYFLWTSSATNDQTGAYSISLSECAFSISSSGTTVGPGNGGGSFLMDTSSGCNWSASSDSTSWLTTSSNGSGDGTVSYNFIANPTTSSRTGRITVGGQVFTVTQIGIGGAGSVRLSASTYSVNENNTGVTITVTRSIGIETGTVQYTTANGTATAGSDYTAASGTILFGETETSKSFTVPILEDSASEGNESFSVSLRNPSLSLTLGTPNTATVTIVDNDSLPPPTANAATGITSNSFIANWSSSSGATGYRLDISTNSSFSSFVSGYQNLDVGNTLSRSITGLTASRLYHYRLRAYNLSSTTASSNTITVSTAGPMIFVEEGMTNRAAALDAVTWLRGPFRLINLFNFSADHRTRVVLFASDLGLTQPDASQLTVQAGGFSLPVESVGPVGGVNGMNASYIIVRLPDGLSAGNLPLVVTLRGLASVNSPTLGIAP
ncbi:MAG TPA: Calx-beta domain-containing protein [Pyrinomonadaceae bacterium]|nr:Calx-beta domain-containing protein [Pyrinomonadaceae bacterium]